MVVYRQGRVRRAVLDSLVVLVLAGAVWGVVAAAAGASSWAYFPVLGMPTAQVYLCLTVTVHDPTAPRALSARATTGRVWRTTSFRTTSFQVTTPAVDALARDIAGRLPHLVVAYS